MPASRGRTAWGGRLPGAGGIRAQFDCTHVRLAQERLQDVFRTLRGEARLSEPAVEAALREIRMALLEADVNFKVVKAFVDRVRERAIGQDVLRSLTPAQQVVRIVRDEMHRAVRRRRRAGCGPSKRARA